VAVHPRGHGFLLRRIVFITQQVDPAHPALAATIPKLAALAARVDEVTVLADGAVPGVLPENCRVRLFRSPWKLGRGLRFEAALAAELARRPERIVAHMCPIYAVLAAPLARPLRVRLLLWYTHWHASPTLRLAEPLVDRVVSVDRRSFPLSSKKVVPTGHGIDLAEFPCAEREPGEELRVLALGRTSPSKGLETIVRAVAQLEGARLEIRGPAISAEERGHREALRALARELDAPVTIEEPIPRAEVPALFARSDVLVNNMRAGAPDKVVYEAGASCLPVLASNPIFEELLDPFPREDANELARRLREFAALGREERSALGRALREQVVAGHSIDSWADKVLAA
jgi:glycosyltransferase involved in cell wall biosynthesis